MFVVDTNILVYAVDPRAQAHDRCRQRLDEWRMRAAPWYLTWGIVYEFLLVVTHPQVFDEPWTPTEALGFVEARLAAPGLRVLVETSGHDTVLGEIVVSVPELRANRFHDAHIVAIMREHGVDTIVTRDTDFHRFPGIDVVDPLR